MTSWATGNEKYLVNHVTINAQWGPSVSALEDGGWVVVYDSIAEGADPSDGIYYRRYTYDGKAIDALDHHVNTNVTVGVQMGASVTGLADGGYVISWMSCLNTGLPGEVYFQRYAADGSTVGNVVDVHADGKSANGDNVRVEGLPDGGFVVLWADVTSGTKQDLYQSLFAADGSIVYENKRVDTGRDFLDRDQNITSLSDGKWIVCWESNYNLNSSNNGIILQTYNSDGTVHGNQFKLENSKNFDIGLPSIAGLADGGYVLTWNSLGQDGDDLGVFMQRFDRFGDTQGPQTQVNSFTSGNQTDATVTGLSDGGFLVTWVSDYNGARQICQQRYGALGGQIGGETHVDPEYTTNQYAPRVTAFADGGWVTTWHGKDEKNPAGGWDIFQRRFAVDVLGDQFDQSLHGTPFDETIIAYGGDDTLDGRAGGDIMIGGQGDDVYHVDDKADDVQEFAHQGNDTVISAIDYSVKNFWELENITLTGNAVNATGNVCANRLIGDNVANVMTAGANDDYLDGKGGVDKLLGGTGNDTYVVDNAKDVADETGGDGVDIVLSTAPSFTLDADIEKLTMLGSGNLKAYGNGLGNIMVGNAGNNLLDGKGGKDVLTGGAGNDIYVVDMKEDQIIEAAGKGNDTVQAFFSFSIEKRIELDNVTLLGTGKLSATGNRLANVLRGNGNDNQLSGLAGDDRINGGAGADRISGGDGKDTLIGDAGADTLHGGKGGDQLKGGAGVDRLFGDDGDDRLEGGYANDVLTGGKGSDTFVFAKGGGSDHITDFAAGSDRIDLRGLKDVTSYKDLRDSHWDSNDHDVTITIGKVKIILDNIDPHDLHARDFMI